MLYKPFNSWAIDEDVTVEVLHFTPYSPPTRDCPAEGPYVEISIFGEDGTDITNKIFTHHNEDWRRLKDQACTRGMKGLL